MVFWDLNHGFSSVMSLFSKFLLFREKKSTFHFRLHGKTWQFSYSYQSSLRLKMEQISRRIIVGNFRIESLLASINNFHPKSEPTSGEKRMKNYPRLNPMEKRKVINFLIFFFFWLFPPTVVVFICFLSRRNSVEMRICERLQTLQQRFSALYLQFTMTFSIPPCLASALSCTTQCSLQISDN